MSISQVSFGQAPQVQGQKRNYAIPAAIAGGAGIVGGYAGHRYAAKEIAKAAAKCDENLIRNELLKFWKWENGVPESSKAFFEKAVKSELDFAKKALESTKKFYKGSGLAAGLAVTALTGIIIGGLSLLRGNNAKKEA